MPEDQTTDWLTKLCTLRFFKVYLWMQFWNMTELFPNST